MEHLKNEDMDLVRGVVVRVECFHCKGQCRVPGGQIQYGEVVPCPICNGTGTTNKVATLEQLQRLLTA